MSDTIQSCGTPGSVSEIPLDVIIYPNPYEVITSSNHPQERLTRAELKTKAPVCFCIVENPNIYYFKDGVDTWTLQSTVGGGLVDYSIPDYLELVEERKVARGMTVVVELVVKFK